MESDYAAIAIHLLAALGAGAAIGLERSYHARPAGFRTHTLVCLSSSLLMLVTLYQSTWLPGMPAETIRTDPTRMAQGIMTGIGFLGAGVIFKEGLSVRGLTTAASIWMTAAIGVLMGIGFYFPAVMATLLTLGILSLFRLIERRMPAQTFVHHHLRFHREDAIGEREIRKLMREHGFSIANMGYRMLEDGESFEYRMTLRSNCMDELPRLADALRKWKQVRSFHLAPTGD